MRLWCPQLTVCILANTYFTMNNDVTKCISFLSEFDLKNLKDSVQSLICRLMYNHCCIHHLMFENIHRHLMLKTIHNHLILKTIHCHQMFKTIRYLISKTIHRHLVFKTIHCHLIFKTVYCHLIFKTIRHLMSTTFDICFDSFHFNI